LPSDDGCGDSTSSGSACGSGTVALRFLWVDATSSRSQVGVARAEVGGCWVGEDGGLIWITAGLTTSHRATLESASGGGGLSPRRVPIVINLGDVRLFS
jgi:hypothetical protein